MIMCRPQHGDGRRISDNGTDLGRANHPSPFLCQQLRLSSGLFLSNPAFNFAHNAAVPASCALLTNWDATSHPLIG